MWECHIGVRNSLYSFVLRGIVSTGAFLDEIELASDRCADKDFFLKIYEERAKVWIDKPEFRISTVCA